MSATKKGAGMAQVAGHLGVAELQAGYRSSDDAVLARHSQVIWLLAQGRSCAEVARLTSFARRWVEQLLERYNAFGPRSLGGAVTFTPANAQRCWIGPLCGGDLAPSRERLRAELAKGAAGDQVALDVEVVVDGGVGGKELLRGARRSESTPLPFSAARRLVRDLRAVVRPPAG